MYDQAAYSLFSANDDAICVAWVTTTYSDDRGCNKYAVSGDFGHACGGSWYASGMFPLSDSEYQPDCFWIDANGDQPNTGFQVGSHSSFFPFRHALPGFMTWDTPLFLFLDLLLAILLM